MTLETALWLGALAALGRRVSLDADLGDLAAELLRVVRPRARA